jgi:hypothetical protein
MKTVCAICSQIRLYDPLRQDAGAIAATCRSAGVVPLEGQTTVDETISDLQQMESRPNHGAGKS